MIEKIKNVNHLQLMQSICLTMAVVMMYFWSNPIATSICFVAAGVYAIAREIQSCSVIDVDSKSKPEQVIRSMTLAEFLAKKNKLKRG